MLRTRRYVAIAKLDTVALSKFEKSLWQPLNSMEDKFALEHFQRLKLRLIFMSQWQKNYLRITKGDQMDKRILFAVARGARAQVQLGPNRGWINSTQLTWHDDCVYRIHPDQLEYQYGPISTALREMAEDYSWNPSWEHRVAHAAADDFAVKFHGEPDYPLFYLILAEALADSGL